MPSSRAAVGRLHRLRRRRRRGTRPARRARRPHRGRPRGSRHHRPRRLDPPPTPAGRPGCGWYTSTASSPAPPGSRCRPISCSGWIETRGRERRGCALRRRAGVPSAPPSSLTSIHGSARTSRSGSVAATGRSSSSHGAASSRSGAERAVPVASASASGVPASSSVPLRAPTAGSEARLPLRLHDRPRVCNRARLAEPAVSPPSSCARGPYASSFCSQARARIQSRCTVRSETPSAWADSSSVMPAK